MRCLSGGQFHIQKNRLLQDRIVFNQLKLFQTSSLQVNSICYGKFDSSSLRLEEKTTKQLKIYFRQSCSPCSLKYKKGNNTIFYSKGVTILPPFDEIIRKSLFFFISILINSIILLDKIEYKPPLYNLLKTLSIILSF